MYFRSITMSFHCIALSNKVKSRDARSCVRGSKSHCITASPYHRLTKSPSISGPLTGSGTDRSAWFVLRGAADARAVRPYCAHLIAKLLGLRPHEIYSLRSSVRFVTRHNQSKLCFCAHLIATLLNASHFVFFGIASA